MMKNGNSVGLASAAGLAAIALALVCNRGAFAAEASRTDVPYAVPPGITIVDIVKEINDAQPSYLWTRLGDAQGNPLYTYDVDAELGKSSCVFECARAFPPVIAENSSVARGDWTLVDRGGGTKQWAYQGNPLYRFSFEKEIDEYAGGYNSGGVIEGGGDDSDLLDPANKVYAPEPGWRMAAFTPAKNLVMPEGVDAREIAAANGFGLVTTNGMTLYILDGDVKKENQICSSDSACTDVWIPLMAAELALPIGNFSVVERADGTNQWAYKGRALYSFEKDRVAGDARGIGVAERIQVALLVSHFIPSTEMIREAPGTGYILSTADGSPLYMRDRFAFQYGGRHTRVGFRTSYNIGKLLGTKGCDAALCREARHPLSAPMDAKARGFWEVLTREDGSRQWAYRGFALYTYDGDKKGEDVSGHNVVEVAFDGYNEIDESLTGGDRLGSIFQYGAGLYWHVAKPNQ